MASQIAPTPYIFLDRMLQQPGLVGNDADWTGSASFARRKLQNRINQRNRREFSRWFSARFRIDP